MRSPIDNAVATCKVRLGLGLVVPFHYRPRSKGKSGRGGAAPQKEKMMSELKRAKCENASYMIYPHFFVYAKSVKGDIPFSKLPGSEKCVSLPEQNESHVLVEGSGKIKLYLAAVEKGDDRLEQLFSGSIEPESYLIILYSPSLRLSSNDPIEYSPYNMDLPSEPISNVGTFNFVSNDLRHAYADQFNNSCILSIPEFCCRDKYREILDRLNAADCLIMGPPDYCRLGSVSGPDIHGIFSEIDGDTLLLYSADFIAYLGCVTGLDLKRPLCQARIHKLEVGSFMMLNEERGDREKGGLDFYWVIGEKAPSDLSVGAIQYINKESGEVVAALEPIPNTMHLAYRSDGALRFIRYIPKSSNLEAPIYYLTITYPIA